MYITYIVAVCTFTYIRKYISYHTQFCSLGKETDEASSDIDISQESRETTCSDDNGDLKLSQPVKRKKMSEEITKAEVTSCKLK